MTIPAGYAQANLVFGGSGVPSGAEVTIGLDVSGSSLDPDGVAAVVADAWDTSNIMGNITVQVEVREVRVKFGPEATGPSGIWTGSIPGSHGENALPPNTSVLIRKLTALGGRAGRGRMYLPGLREDRVDQQGAIATGELADLNTTINAFHTIMDGANLPPVVLHGPGSPLSTPTPITSWAVDSIVATQRRRLRR